MLKFNGSAILKSLTHTNFLKVLLLSFFLFLSRPLFAQDSGQIININQNYQIAFTDLGNGVLKQGDVVKVSINNEEFVYMQVLESSAILSKLGFCQNEGFKTSLKDFQRLAVGNVVIKTTMAQENNTDAKAHSIETKDVQSVDQSQIQKLEQDLNIAKDEIKRLQEANETANLKISQLTAEVNLKKTEQVVSQPSANNEILKQIKSRVDNMYKIANEKK